MKEMKHYWTNQGSIILVFSISLLVCINFQLASFILLSKQIAATSEDCLKQFKHDSEKQNDRITLLELQNKKQDDGIEFLRTDMAKHRNQIGRMKENNKLFNGIMLGESFSLLDEKENGADDTTNQHVIRQEKQRAARLIPKSLLVGNKDKDEEKYTRPPTSCKDLNAVGHTLNGIYLIKKNNNSISKMVDVVFCNFMPQQKRSSSSLTVTENKLGYLNINKSASGIYFYVQRHGSLPTAPNGVIRFNKERLNIGRAMNLSSGVFTAPKAGIYHFSTTIVKEAVGMAPLSVYIRLNGQKIGLASVGLSTMAAIPAVIQSTLKMKKGDRIDVWKPSGGTLGFLNTDPGTHHFTGWLLNSLEENELE